MSPNVFIEGYYLITQRVRLARHFLLHDVNIALEIVVRLSLSFLAVSCFVWLSRKLDDFQ
jgi:hypothetical protein